MASVKIAYNKIQGSSKLYVSKVKESKGQTI